MSRKFKFSDNDKLYFVSYAVVHWIDVFIRNEYRDILLESWKFCQQEKDLDIYGWCIMTNHVHMIVGSKGRPLHKTIGEMKSFTSRALRKAIATHPKESRREWILNVMEQTGWANSNNIDWQCWQQNSHPIVLLDRAMFFQKLEYIHTNPVKAGFVDRPECYVYSSARDFCGVRGLIELSYID